MIEFTHLKLCVLAINAKFRKVMHFPFLFSHKLYHDGYLDIAVSF